MLDKSLIHGIDNKYNAVLRFDRQVAIEEIVFQENKLYPYFVKDEGTHTDFYILDNDNNEQKFVAEDVISVIGDAGFNVFGRGLQRKIERHGRVVVLKNGQPCKGFVAEVLDDGYLVRYSRLNENWCTEQEELPAERVAHYEDYCVVVDPDTKDAVFSYSDAYITEHSRAIDLIGLRKENNESTRTSTRHL